MTSLRIHGLLAAAVMTLGIWLSSGTMAPYAATDLYPIVTEPCHYLVNVDHPHHVALFLMLAGADRDYWERSVVLRRVLYPAVAYPFVRLAGMLAGGLLANILINVGAALAFSAFVRRRWGLPAAITVLWLLATYPGITYWAGLPYGYAAIVPGTLWAMALLYRLQEAQTFRDVVSASTMLGICFLAYDLFPFFVPAAVLVLIARSRYVWAAGAVAIAMIPTVVVAAMFSWIGSGASNSNSGTYGVIVSSYLNPGDLSAWAAEWMKVPAILWSNFVFSNFIFLPLLAIVAAVVLWRKNVRPPMPEVALLLAVLALFLFNNAAPPYYGWQMRGTWMARLYQPVFVVFLLMIGRAVTLWRPMRVAVALVVLANAAIVGGPVTMTPLGQYAYHRFYAHSPQHALNENVQRHGRRPLGFCRASHDNDGRINPNTPFNRPPFMFRYREEGR